MSIRWIRNSKHASESELYDADLPENERFVAFQVLDVFEQLRRNLGGKPIKITSGRRSEAKQKWLIENGYKAAKVSTHCYGVALDLSLPVAFRFDGGDAKFAAEIILAASQLGHRTPRIGYLQYRQPKWGFSTWVHFDFAFLLQNKNLPKEWAKSGVIW